MSWLTHNRIPRDHLRESESSTSGLPDGRDVLVQRLPYRIWLCRIFNKFIGCKFPEVKLKSWLWINNCPAMPRCFSVCGKPSQSRRTKYNVWVVFWWWNFLLMIYRNCIPLLESRPRNEPSGRNCLQCLLCSISPLSSSMRHLLRVESRKVAWVNFPYLLHLSCCGQAKANMSEMIQMIQELDVQMLPSPVGLF